MHDTAQEKEVPCSPGTIVLEDNMPNYTDEHASAGISVKLPALETWPNQ